MSVTRWLKSLPYLALLGMTGVVGWWLGRAPQTPERKTIVDEVTEITVKPPAQLKLEVLPTEVEMSRAQMPDQSRERLVAFPDRESFDDFLREGASGVEIISSDDALLTARVRYDRGSQIGRHIGSGDVLVNSEQKRPRLPDGGVQPGAVGFGGQLLDWLGIADRPLSWGEGVTVAIVDSGVTDHPTFQTEIVEIEIRDNTQTPEVGHGTAVASLIAGAHPQAAGIAPSARLISIPVTNTEGTSDTFTVAQAIVAAVDAGASFVNLSLGGEPSPVLNRAIEYANAAGVVLIAATGNDGLSRLNSPASHPGVYSVGSIDGRSNLLDFSSRDFADINAPGLAINAAFPGEKLVRASGTSMSAPIVLGAAAAYQSMHPEVTPVQAIESVLRFAGDAGPAGVDQAYGGGEIDFPALLNNGSPNYENLAVSGVYYEANSSGSRAGEMVTVYQNRGTEIISGAEVSVTGDIANTTFAVGTLVPGATTSFRFPVSSEFTQRSEGFQMQTEIKAPPGRSDAFLRDNTRDFQFTPRTP